MPVPPNVEVKRQAEPGTPGAVRLTEWLAGIGAVSAKLRRLVVANCRTIRIQREDVLQLFSRDLLVGCDLRFPENLLPDREVTALLFREIALDEAGTCTAEVVDAIGEVLTDIDLSVRVGDLVHHPSADFGCARHRLERQAIGAALATWTAPVEDVGAVGAISVTATGNQTLHLVRALAVVGSCNSARPPLRIC